MLSKKEAEEQTLKPVTALIDDILDKQFKRVAMYEAKLQKEKIKRSKDRFQSCLQLD
jgi:hypothetical protein